MAGGDDSQALVASIAVEHDLPFVCVSAGTRNHFALDLGIDREDPRLSLHAFREAVERRIDYATVGDRLFVNNVSLGIYATIVQQEGYRDAKKETTKALLPELLGRATEPFDLQFTKPDGTEVDGAYLIQVSNNPYVLGATLDASQRRRLDTGMLGVVAITAATGAEAAAVVTLSALGQRRRSRHWHEFTAEQFTVRSRSGRAYAGIDGEALELDTPLEFRIHPRRLAATGRRREPHRCRAAPGPRRLVRRPDRHRPKRGPARRTRSVGSRNAPTGPIAARRIVGHDGPGRGERDVVGAGQWDEFRAWRSVAGLGARSRRRQDRRRPTHRRSRRGRRVRDRLRLRRRHTHRHRRHGLQIRPQLRRQRLTNIVEPPHRQSRRQRRRLLLHLEPGSDDRRHQRRDLRYRSQFVSQPSHRHP